LMDVCHRSTGSPKPSQPPYRPHYHFDDEGYQDEDDDDDDDGSVPAGNAFPVVPTEAVPVMALAQIWSDRLSAPCD
jgi:hypothetical protein